MKKQLKSNSGFTLIELIIAIAILAFLMTAVSSFMASGVLSFKKAKADITVHNSAQETYNQLMDSIMQANDIVIYGYTVDTTPPEDGSAVVSAIDFSTSGADITANLNEGPVYYVRDDKQWNEFKNTSECHDSSATPVYFEDIPDGTVLYIKEMIIDTAVPIDMTYITPSSDDKYDDAINGGGKVLIVQEMKADGNPVLSATGENVYNVNDTQRNIFTFDEENMYFERRYSFMTALDDYDGEMNDYLYSESFAYVNVPAEGTSPAGSVTGCVATVDAENSSVGIDLYFSDKNMTYTTQGMIKIRNSYVLRPKR
ncbi:MAG: prepilin-type N-terminal cleavage/methylation domain-containing protein [Lachnospiraceae bacterium]|nr:prepilin-type N-terminal cleavage/methylation domain-containing protein [Lachnospiraceae bacterium]